MSSRKKLPQGMYLRGGVYYGRYRQGGKLVRKRRSLTADEVARFIANSSPLLRPLWYSLLTTGARREEIVDLQFDDVDFERSRR